VIHAYFCTSRSVLTASARKALDAEISEWRSCIADREVVVRGYADTRGASEINAALGERRAAALAAILRDRGLKVAEVTGVGELGGLDDGQNCANQRRVDIALESEVDKATPSRACAPPEEAVPIACDATPPIGGHSPSRAR
jgi:outer membrane protein OmpA-like peptidoglycan-associated protein